jgi:hypothetical protein
VNKLVTFTLGGIEWPTPDDNPKNAICGSNGSEAAPYENPPIAQFLWKNSSDSIPARRSTDTEAQAGLLCLSNPYKTNGANYGDFW